MYLIGFKKNIQYWALKKFDATKIRACIVIRQRNGGIMTDFIIP